MMSKEMNLAEQLLLRLCRESVPARQHALEEELEARGIPYENWDDMALVVPADVESPIVCTAHYDAVEGSRGYNDNGMALVTMLEMIPKFRGEAEFVFTNGEERGGLGAMHYLDRTAKEIRGCVAMDVVGCFDQVYLDPMNFAPARRLSGCKQGKMPPNDGCVFAKRGIPSVCLSSGPADTTFGQGIWRICETLHNNVNDNKLSLINFSMIPQVAAAAEEIFRLMGTKNAA